MIRIAFIHPNYPTSEGTGATHSATQIVECLNRSDDFSVTCFCLSNPVDLPDDKYDYDFILNQNSSIHTGHQLNNSILENKEKLLKFDVIHSYLPITIPSLNKISNHENISTSVTLNAYKAICPKNDMMFLNKKNCGGNGIIKCITCSTITDRYGLGSDNSRKLGSKMGNLNLIRKIDPVELKIDRFHALSSGVKQSYIDQGYHSSKIHVISNLPNTSFNVEHKSNFQEPYRLLYVGYLKENKGAHLLPKIVSNLQKISDVRFSLTIAGSGEKREQMRKDIRKFGIEDSINMLGHVSHDELPRIYASHDLFVYPGIWEEPFGRVLIESLSAGTPVVGTNVGNVSEIVGDAGMITTPDPIRIAETICSVFQNSRLVELHNQTKKEMKKYNPNTLCEEFRDYFRMFD
jgi:glycosyltransferase involved in cell wall biosynthesis